MSFSLAVGGLAVPSIAGPSIAADAQGGSGFAPVAHAASSKSGIVPSDVTVAGVFDKDGKPQPQPWTVDLSLIHISEPTRPY